MFGESTLTSDLIVSTSEDLKQKVLRKVTDQTSLERISEAVGQIARVVLEYVRKTRDNWDSDNEEVQARIVNKILELLRKEGLKEGVTEEEYRAFIGLSFAVYSFSRYMAVLFQTL